MILHRSTYVYLFQIAVLGAIFQEQVNKVVAIESDESTDPCVWKSGGFRFFGNEKNDQFGMSVSLSSSGEYLAAGAPKVDVTEIGTNVGQVNVYMNKDETWDHYGNRINGTENKVRLGSSVSISGDGKSVAVGSLDERHLDVFKSEAGVWKSIGGNIVSTSESIDIESSKIDVSLSYDGTKVAVGIPQENEAAVYVLKTNGNWGRLGGSITSENDDIDFGSSVSISSDGEFVAVGSPNSNGKKGMVMVMTYEDYAWIEVGKPIIGEVEGDMVGTSISLSDDGNVLAIGCPNHEMDNVKTGHVHIYKKSNTNGVYSWDLYGDEIMDTSGSGSEFGSSIDLSGDGTTVAIGAPQSNDGHGTAQVYRYLAAEEKWLMIGDINGRMNEESGASVSISSDGSIVAIGANRFKKKGAVRVYEYICPTRPTVSNTKSSKSNAAITGFGYVVIQLLAVGFLNLRF